LKFCSNAHAVVTRTAAKFDVENCVAPFFLGGGGSTRIKLTPGRAATLCVKFIRIHVYIATAVEWESDHVTFPYISAACNKILITIDSSVGIAVALLFATVDSSVGIALGHGLDDRGSRVQFPARVGNFSFHHRIQNGSGAHPVSCSMGTRGSFLGDKAARA
jgi:hypothetical protein